MSKKEPISFARTVTATSFGFALIQLDVTIVNVALPKIAADLHTTTAGLQWVVDAYALIFAALLLSAGFLGDRLGAKRTFLFGFWAFAGASLLCSLSPTIVWLVAARALQGVGAAAMLPNSLTLLNFAAHGDQVERAKGIGWWTAAGSISIAAGPIIGGALVGSVGWRSIFWVNVPLCVVGYLLSRTAEETVQTQEKSHFDVKGQILGATGLAAFVAFVIEAKPLGFSSPIVWGLLAVSILSAGGFLLVENASENPMLPLRLLKHPQLVASVLYGVMVNLSYYGIVFVLSLYLQSARGYTAQQAGFAYLPLTASFFLSNVASGHFAGKMGSRWPMVAGAVLDAVGFGLLLLLGSQTSYLIMIPGFLLIPMGMGFGVPAMTSAVLSSIEKEESGVASGVLNSARQAAGAIGVALFGSAAAGKAPQIIRGLHTSSLISIGLLLLAGVLAGLFVSSRQAAKA